MRAKKGELKAARARETRRLILESAARMVGKHGYPGCSISRVTTEAGIGHGAFYLHFESRQQLLEQMVRTFGTEMMRAINDATKAATNIYELEELSLTANHRYLSERPYLYAVISQGRIFAEDSYIKLNETVNHGYLRALNRFVDIPSLGSLALPMAVLLAGARWRLLLRLGSRDADKPLPPRAVKNYVNFACSGVLALTNSAHQRASRAAPGHHRSNDSEGGGRERGDEVAGTKRKIA